MLASDARLVGLLQMNFFVVRLYGVAFEVQGRNPAGGGTNDRPTMTDGAHAACFPGVSSRREADLRCRRWIPAVMRQ